MAELLSAELLDEGLAVNTAWADGSHARFHAIWLRDNAMDPDTRADNGQRLITVNEIARDIRLTTTDVTDGALTVSFAPEGKQVSFPAEWLMAHRYDRADAPVHGRLPVTARAWDADLDVSKLEGNFDAIMSDDARLQDWLTGIRTYGFATVVGGPTEPQSMLRLVERFGFVRETNYGKWFEVRTEVNPTNLAYTGLGLQAHTDNPYRDPQPTMQVLYCLENSTDGGESLVVDGFAVAQRLQAENPASFDLLSRYCARFEYSGQDGVCLRSRCPIIDLSPDGELRGVRFNNRSAAAITDVPYEHMADYYAALQHFADIIDDPAMAPCFKLGPGEAFIVDNTRVLHSRRAFSSGGSRWLQGCYPDKDGLLSTLSALESRGQEAAE